jgi:hypothetical protein
MQKDEPRHRDVPPLVEALSRRTGLLLLLILFTYVFTGNTALALEEPEFAVVETFPDFELRRYRPYLVAEVEVSGTLRSSGNRAFRILADYIFGGNGDDERMQMTAPVESIPDTDLDRPAFSEARATANGSWTYAFVMERRYTRESLPAPLDQRIHISQRPERLMAVRRFSGRWSTGNVSDNETALLAAIQKAGLAAVGTPVLARYDAPFIPWFLRRNEIMVPVEASRAAAPTR